MVLEHAHALAQRLDDAELAVGVVVGQDVRTPEKEIVRPPARPVAELVLHDGDEGGGEGLSRNDFLTGRERGADVEVEAIVPLLQEVKRDGNRQECDHYEDEHDGRGTAALVAKAR